MSGLRTTVAALAASGVLEHGRNRAIVTEAAGLPVSRALTADSGPVSTGPIPAPAREALGPEGLAIGHRSDHAAGAGATPAGAPWVDPRLLAVLGEPRRIPRLDGEDAIQASIVLGFDVGTRAGRWSIVPVILRNDIRVRTASEGELSASPALARWHQRQQRQAWREAARAKAMGLRPGAPDLLLLSPAGFGFLEVKSPGAGLRPEQRAWRDLCEAMAWRWGLARSWDDALRAVRCWGWL